MNTCPTSGKVRHANPQAAHRAVAHQNTRERRGRAASAGATYQCPDCRDWHVRTPPPRALSARPARRAHLAGRSRR